ncbi:hypothetical protein BKA82DRAFT_21340 [Pisolithus tinctorius]|uniref:Uncharacterized protein n=1 Tax=Pisolithus tinctorius Marx 270 TaxID=870435 RepID=A0A0C3PNG7_PISTI|nr:hypothetical protein BKA82DRAFT_21340 [Pisolithus tinctorius]KIO10396.1 hypothetical protein M404DRAFT_21340 [Pisolithus tinctorius Marx 270]
MPSHVFPKVSFGKLEVSGEGETKVGTAVEDRIGTRAMSPSITSPTHPIPLIIMRGETVGLTVRSTLATAWLKPILGPEMCLFKAPLADERCTLQDRLHFRAGCAVTAEQLSLNTAKLRVDQYQHTIRIPLSVDATNAKLRVARKSNYVEVDAPMTLTLNVKGESD